MRHADDATSVQMIVKELQNETYDPVLIYKPQRVKRLDWLPYLKMHSILQFKQNHREEGRGEGIV